MDTSLHIDSIRKQLLLQSFKNEIKFLTSDTTHTSSKDKLVQLETILGQIEKTNDVGEKKNVEKLFDEVDKVIFRRPWNRLPPIHKIVKIKEYLTNFVKDDILRTKISDDLINLVNTNKLNTKKHVVYDPIKEQIESIPVLYVDNSP